MLRTLAILCALGWATAAGARPLEAQDVSAAAHDSATARSPVGGSVLAGVRAGDVLRIAVWPDEALSGEFPVEDTGYTYLPVIGRIRVTGYTLPGLRALLRDAYGQAMKTPVVTITPIVRVTVLGGVAQPGIYSVEPTVTFHDLITMAGGFTEDAEPDALQLFRDGNIYSFDATAAFESGDFSDSPMPQSGDRIVVPTKRGVSWSTLQTVFQFAVSLATLYGVFR